MLPIIVVRQWDLQGIKEYAIPSKLPIYLYVSAKSSDLAKEGNPLYI